jgi:hypothetical protein
MHECTAHRSTAGNAQLPFALVEMLEPCYALENETTDFTEHARIDTNNEIEFQNQSVTIRFVSVSFVVTFSLPHFQLPLQSAHILCIDRGFRRLLCEFPSHQDEDWPPEVLWRSAAFPVYRNRNEQHRDP